MYITIGMPLSNVDGSLIHMRLLVKGWALLTPLNIIGLIKVRNPFRNFSGLETDRKLSICLGLEKGCPFGEVVGNTSSEANSHGIVLSGWE